MHHKHEENKLEGKVRELERQCTCAEELESQIGWKCDFVGLRIGAVEVCILVRCDVQPVGDWCPTFRDSAMVSQVDMPMLCFGTLEYREDHAASKCRGSTCHKNGDLKVENRSAVIGGGTFVCTNKKKKKKKKKIKKKIIKIREKI
jgi:hypothetical protein